MMIFFVIGIIFDLARMSIHLIFIFLDDRSITVSCWGIKELALLASFIWRKILFRELTQSLAGLAAISTISVSE